MSHRESTTVLFRALRACRRRLMVCMTLRSALAALQVGLFAFACALLVDLDAGLYTTGRARLLATVLGVAATVWLWQAARMLTLSLRRTAQLADAKGGDRRRRVQTALELCGDHFTHPGTPRHMTRHRSEPEPAGRTSGCGVPGTCSDSARAFLVELSVSQATERLHALRWSSLMDRQSSTRAVRRLASVAALVLGGVAVVPALRTHALRILCPRADIPPYSRYEFTVSPELVELAYGGTAELRVHVSGPSLTSPVQLVTLSARGRFSASCFQEADRTFSQRLENVSEPLRFCFKTGRARSRWQPVALLEEPRIVAASCRVVPPAYSGLPVRSIDEIPAELNVLRGSAIRLTLTSNRELTGAAAELCPSESERTREVEGDVQGRQATIAFTAGHSNAVTVAVRGPGGLTCPDPLRFALIARPDELPDVSLEGVALFMLATPGVSLDIGVHASDDLGVRRVDLFRALSGYRDRAETVVAGARDRSVSGREILNLAELGVVPGDVLELFAEARDTNPALTGIGVCPVHRIQIISEERYAAMLRAETTIAEFLDRFRIADQAMQRVAAAFDRMQKALNQQADKQELRQQALDLIETLDQAREQLRGLTDDFAVYDLEHRLQKALSETMAELDRARTSLAGRDPADGNFRRDLTAAHDALFAYAERVAEQRSRAEDAARVGRVMEAARQFLYLIGRQDQIVRQLSRYEHAGLRDDPAYYRGLAARQRQVDADVSAWCANLRSVAGELPPAFSCLEDCARLFADAVDIVGIHEAMREAASEADAMRGRSAYDNAAEALRLMRSVLPEGRNCPKGGGRTAEGNCLALMMSGKACPDGGAGLNPTLRQMLDALCRNAGNAPGPGQGDANGPGASAGGNAAYGYSMRSVPVRGPARRHLASATTEARAGEGNGRAENRIHTHEPVIENAAEKGGTAAARAATAAPRVHDVPPRYREAVRRYLTRNPGRTAAPPKEKHR